MKTVKINLGKQQVKITLIMRSAFNFRKTSKKDFKISSKGWNNKIVKESDEQYFILLKITAEQGGTLVNINRLVTRFAVALMKVSESITDDKDLKEKIFREANYKLVEHLLNGYINRKLSVVR